MYTREVLQKQRSVLSPDKLALLQQRLHGKADTNGQLAATIPCRPHQGPAPLSFAQERLWFLYELEPDSATYNETITSRLRGRLDLEAFNKAYTEIVRRHEILRTTFQVIDDQPVQVVNPPPESWQIVVEELSHLPAEEREARAQALVHAERQRPFNLRKEYPWRGLLVRMGEEEHILSLTQHHIACDGWSVGVFNREFVQLYRAHLTGRPAGLPELPVQYADYALWERQELQGPALERRLAYWRQQLAAPLPTLELPTDRPRPAVQSYRGARHNFVLPASLTQSLQTLCQREEVTLFMVLLAAFKALLFHHTGQTDIIVGSPTANRNRPEVENLIGFFVNTLALRTNLSGNPTFSELIRRVRAVTLDAYAHQDMPFEKLVEELQPERDLSRTPFFQVMFSLQNAPMDPPHLPHLVLSPVEAATETAKFDLELIIEERAAGLTGVLEYNTDLFDAATMARMAEHFHCLLQGVVADPAQQLLELPFLAKEEQHQLLVGWNQTDTRFPQDKCFPELFEAQVQQTPDAVAALLVGADGSRQALTYQALNQRANRMAHALRQLGVGPEVVVALLDRRGLDLLAAILAVFKAGGAYLPLDPDHPPHRYRQILAQSKVALVLASEALRPKVNEALAEMAEPVSVLSLVTLLSTDGPEGNLPPASTPDNLAYVIYTSGSTGLPKGAMVENKGMINHLFAKIVDLDLTEDDTIAQNASQCFDISVWQFLAALVVGGQVCIYPDEIAHDPAYLLPRVVNDRITILEVVPSLMRAMLEEVSGRDERERPDLSGLRWLIPTGEALPPALSRQWHRYYPRLRLLNAYGPTECSDDVTHYPIYEPPAEWVVNMPIGRPIANTRIYLLNKALRPVAIGVPGELYVGGVGVGRGYLNEPRRTALAFVPDPFTAKPGARLYKTGDLARYLPDGNIEFLGRRDHQVKIRGFRIELGEIEATLAACPSVHAAVVLAQANEHGDKQLVAYVVPKTDGKRPVEDKVASPQPPDDGSLATTELRDFLQAKLPGYMIPAAFVFLAELPLTPNGKINRRALAESHPVAFERQTPFVRPRSEIEQHIAAIWENVLDTRPIGIYDDFFALGGHSLLAIRIMARVRRLLQVDISLRTLFERPTVAGLAGEIERRRREETEGLLPAIQPVPRDGELPQSFAQQRLWFLYQFEPEDASYAIPLAVRMRGALNVDALEQSITRVIERHEALRTTFAMGQEQPIQLIQPPFVFRFSVRDLRHLAPEAQSAAIAEISSQETRRPFDLSQGPLLRGTLLQVAETEFICLLVVHHIVFDEWSLDVFTQEVIAFYRSLVSHQPVELPELPIQYADYAAWQHAWLQGEVLQRQLAYWREQLSGAPAILELPRDRPRPPRQTFQGATLSFRLPEKLSQALRELSQQEGVTLFMTLLAAFKGLLYRYSGQEDIVVGIPVTNRSQVETEALVGFFLNSLALRTDLSGSPTFRELLARVRNVTLGAYAHQDLPFEKLVEELRPQRNLSHHPIFQVMFVLENLPDALPELPGLVLEPVDIQKGATDFGLTLLVREAEDELQAAFEYNTDLYNADTIARMAVHLQILLEGIVADTESQISRLPLLSEWEKRQLVTELGRGRREFSQASPSTPTTIHALFERQAAKTPEGIAVCSGEQQLTYRELDRQANRLARYLQKSGVGPETVVGVSLERSPMLVIAVLGILKAGGVYLPLDPAYPPERVRFMLADSQVLVLLTQQSILAPQADAAFTEFKSDALRTVCLDAEWEAIAQERDDDLDSQVSAGNLACLIYTSGSTGRPKGVMIEHGALAAYCQQACQMIGLDASSRLLQFASISFDMALEEIFAALIAGAALVLRNDEMLSSVARFLAQCQAWGITVLDLPTAFWHEIVATLKHEDLTWPATVQRVIIGGERALPERVQSWQMLVGPQVQLLNTYGPSEATIVATAADLTGWRDPAGGEIPIGRPIGGTEAYVLDAQLEPVPLGVPGELYIGGSGLARGYLNRPALTAERFVPNPFSGAGSRIYRTGDLVRFRPDGNIEFLGRLDHQVKIRGFRIELGEIETVLAEHPSVHEAAAVAQTTGDGEKWLVVYVVPTNHGQPAATEEVRPDLALELQRFLGEKLPAYMIPGTFIFLEALPLSTNGKIDRRALPVPERARPQGLAYVAPRSPAEEIMAQIWSDLLQIEKIGIHDDFFSLGGHSLIAIRLVSRIRSAFQVEISLRLLLEAPTVAGLVQHVEAIQWLAQAEAAQANDPPDAFEELEL